MKRINIFKSRLDTLDRNPILKKILEKDSRDNSKNNINEEEEKKEKNKGQEEFVYYSFKKQMQANSKKFAKEEKKKEETSPEANKKSKSRNVHSRLANNKKDAAEEDAVKIDNTLNLKYETARNLYVQLSKAKNEKEYRQIARESWKNFKTNYDKTLADLKGHTFIQNFVKENKKYNIYLPDFNKEKKKNVNIEEDEKKQKEMMGEDDEIFNMIDRIMSGAVYEKWRSLQDKDL
jgi:hypothetical protein